MKQTSIPSLEEWVDSEPELNKKTTELFESDLSIEVQAREALHYLVQVYGLPLTPLDLVDREEESEGDSSCPPISVFEQIAQLLFVDPENNDPRYLVINSAYLIKHKLTIDMTQELEEFLGKNELQGLGYRGEDILTAELLPVKMGESWSELGCRFFIKDDVS
ncbi:hypothetical protein [Algoriphagus sp. Y33]|uniref:hypothetical protein n=1 Tax=Algoriphagus sp. Y33 TaxID=2772483 RepID=UPI0017862423|nr:hypothetical protein [Algoriphagus sp. Y33]